MSAKDISRFLFQPQKRYSSVRMQQGRVILDSDWNESERIDDEEARQILAETVCAKGTPNEGFLVREVTEATVTEPPAPTKETYDFALDSGSFYLGGLRFETITEILAQGPDIAERFLSQTDWLQIDADLGNLPARPSVADLTNADGSFKVRQDLVYLRGWEQPVTAVEDSELRERALGGPDTSVRLRRMRRIEVLPDVDLDPARRDFCDAAFAKLKAQLTAPREGDNTGKSHLFDEANCELRSKARLTITFGGVGITEDPCKPKVTAGFLGAENQTIRVQLTATNRFIWGYDNASPLYRIQVVEGQPVKIKFLTLPHDQAAQPLKGQAVEILPWSALLPNQEKVAELQGHLATVATSFNPETEEKTITLSKPVPQAWIDWVKAPEHAQYLSERDPVDKKKYFYLRLWTGGSGDADEPDQAFTPGTPVELLGTGLNVTFSQHGLPGDFWIIAARPNTPDLVVPWDLLKEAPPAGPRFFFAPLALVRWTVAIPPAGGEIGVRATVLDCRHTFLPLCEVGGGGTVPVDFAHICAINWVHPTPPLIVDGKDNPTNITSINNLKDNGVLIAFDRPVLNGDIHRHSFMVLVKHRDDQSRTDCWCELPIGRVGGVQFERDCEILSDFTETNDPNATVNGAQFLPGRLGFVEKQEYRVILKGDFIRDAKNEKGIDADHLPPWLPKRPTGDGTEGGTFESWFVTVAPQVPAKVIRVEPPDGAEFDTGVGNLPRPPEFIGISFDKSLQGTTVNGNTVRVVRSVNGRPAELWPGTVAYDDATRSARFEPKQPFGTEPSGLRLYTLTVIGDGPDRILDVDGLALDGNGDGSPGGNFTSTFTVENIIIL
jgi:hypothetical protein